MKDHKTHSHTHSHNHAHNHCCSHDHATEQLSKNALEELKVQSDLDIISTFSVANMDCADEIKAVQEALKISGVKKVQANLMSSTIQVLHLKTLEQEVIIKKIETTVVKVVEKNSNNQKQQNRNRILLVAISGLFLVFGLLLKLRGSDSFIYQLPYLVSILFGGVLVFPKALGALKRKTLDMNVLMTVATIGAVIIGEYLEAASVVFLFSLSELLESLSVQRARKAIGELLNITPAQALVVEKDGNVTTKNVEEVQLKEIIRVKAGENIPLDGTITYGTSTVNQAPLTGESIPVTKIIGETVFAGTINIDGTLDIEVAKIYNETKISNVIRLVEEAQNQRAQSQKFVDQFAKYYTPIVLVLAILTFLIPPLLLGQDWNYWFYKALVLLIIACPCALVISTPVSIVSSLTALARQGVLVKGGASLEVLGQIKALALDKTGTITKGRPAVNKVINFGNYNESDILNIAASIEAHSTHPLAQAILTYAKDKGISPKTLEKFTNVTGRGVEAILNGHHYILGNHVFVHETGICTPELEKRLYELEDQSYSLVIIGHKPHEGCVGELIGIIALADEIKEEAKGAIHDIKELGVEKIIMLSGDNQKTASAVAKKVGIDEARGDLLPEGKVQEIERLNKEFKTVAMIGDGINDAPAMAKSSLGIAMAAIGSDIAIETADVALMNDRLSQVFMAIKAGKRTLNIIKFNIAFALITKAIFFVLTFMGYSNLWLAILADTGASILVILNSLRLLKVRE